MTKLLPSLPVLAAMAVAACSGGTADAPPTTIAATIAGSCYVEATGNCSEWLGSDWARLTMDRLCVSQKGSFTAGAACPTTNLVGSCLRDRGKKSESRFFFYTSFPGYGVKLTPDAVAEAGNEQCTKFMKGEWRGNAP